VLVLSDDLTIENANPAACQFCGFTHDEIKGRPLRSLFQVDSLQVPISGMDGGESSKVYEFETSLKKDNAEGIQLLAKMNVFKIGASQRVVLILRDITERKKAEHEREELINKLTDALAEVRALSGLLPICAHCKKIRDDKGYWKQLEEYFHTHSDVRFSHGLCPDCVKELYPMITDKRKKKQ
jgi:PAS domain S-box-containing protein